MYCYQCRDELHYADLDHHGWCARCNQIVRVTQCKVSYWFVAAAFIALWAVQPGM